MAEQKKFTRWYHLLFWVLFCAGWNCLAWTASMQMIKAGHFNEISGPGGHVIGEVSASKQPGDFWTCVLIFPCAGTFFALLVIYKVFEFFSIRKTAENRPATQGLHS